MSEQGTKIVNSISVGSGNQRRVLGGGLPQMFLRTLRFRNYLCLYLCLYFILKGLGLGFNLKFSENSSKMIKGPGVVALAFGFWW